MKALIVIELPEDHFLKTMNDLYDRLKGYKCELKPMPNKKEENDDGTHFSWHSNDWWSAGWNACLEEIEK